MLFNCMYCIVNNADVVNVNVDKIQNVSCKQEIMFESRLCVGNVGK